MESASDRGGGPTECCEVCIRSCPDLTVRGQSGYVNVDYFTNSFRGVDELLVQYDTNRRATWPLQDAGGDVIALCDRGGANGAARVLTQIVYDAYGRVIGRDDPHNPATPSTGPPELRVGHKGLFFDRLDAGIFDVTLGRETPRLAPGARLSGYARNRTLHADLGRWNQPDPNATGLPVQGYIGFHGDATDAEVQSFDLGSHFGDGPNVREYVGGNAYAKWDPTGLFVGTLDVLTTSTIRATATTNEVSRASTISGMIAGLLGIGLTYTAASNGVLIQNPHAYTVQGMMGQLSIPGERLTDIEIQALSTTDEAPTNLYPGMILYRVWGNRSPKWGNYWTTIDPRSVPNYRSIAGLYDSNSGENLTIAKLHHPSVAKITPGGAAPGPGGPGGLPEVKIPLPSQLHLREISTTKLKPPL